MHAEDRGKRMEKATFAAGCFWGVEAAFRRLPGVLETSVGYAGGHTTNPTYEEVCRGGSGHAEAVQVAFDPQVISYDALLDHFWQLHDPTTPNRQGPDIGSQYRSAIYTHGPEQAAAAAASKAALASSGRHGAPVVTEIEEAGPYYRAEDYHQNYFDRRRTILAGRLR